MIAKFFEEISQDSSKYVFGVKDTLMCLDMGAVEVLIVWEALDCDRYELLNTATSKVEVKHLSSEQVRPLARRGAWQGGGGADGEEWDRGWARWGSVRQRRRGQRPDCCRAVVGGPVRCKT